MVQSSIKVKELKDGKGLEYITVTRRGKTILAIETYPDFYSANWKTKTLPSKLLSYLLEQLEISPDTRVLIQTKPISGKRTLSLEDANLFEGLDELCVFLSIDSSYTISWLLADNEDRYVGFTSPKVETNTLKKLFKETTRYKFSQRDWKKLTSYLKRYS